MDGGGEAGGDGRRLRSFFFVTSARGFGGFLNLPIGCLESGHSTIKS